MSPTQAILTPAELRQYVQRVPRVRLAHLPTPLEPLTSLSRELGGPPLWIKRDDCTGLAFGGNKTRHNEFILADARDQQAEVLVWGAGVQSNNCRQTAAACALLGIECRLFLSRGKHGDEVQGNLLLDHLLGANVQVVDAAIGPELDDLLAAEAQKLRSEGRRVYHWDRHVCKPLAAVSYVLCLVEIVEQLAEQGLRPGAIYVCSAGSTGAGAVLAKAALGLDMPLRLVAPVQWPWDTAEDLAQSANKAAELAGLSHRVLAADIDATDDYIGAGYGIPTEAGMEALSLMARREGILLDPVYTGKAMSALIDDIRQGRLTTKDPAIFIHTGGTPALFAYRDELLGML